MQPIKKRKHFFPAIIIVCIALVILPFLGAYLFLKHEQDNIINMYLEKVKSDTGIAITFDDVNVNFLPLPSLTMSNVSIKLAQTSFTTGWLLIRPDFLALIKGNFVPAKMVLLRPRMESRLYFPLLKDNNLNILKKFFNSPKSGDSILDKLYSYLENKCSLEIGQGEIKILGSDEAIINMTGMNCDMEIGRYALSGNFNFVALNMRDKDNLIFGIERFEIDGESDLQNILEDSTISTRMQIRVPKIVDHATLNVQFEASSTGWDAKFGFDGSLALQKSLIPAAFSGRLIGLSNSSEIAIRGLSMQLDADRGQINAALVLPQKNSDFELKGTLLLERFSLTQWLGFARNLMPGLAIALDNVTDGSLDFILTSKSLAVPRIRACSLGSCFTGFGSVKDFAKPNVFLDLRTDKVNLGAAIPEAIGEFPDAPIYSHDTLTPRPGKPSKPGEAGIDYDINLASSRVVYGPMRITNGKVRITQGKMDKTGLEDVLIYADGKAYGGTVKGLCILGGAKNLPMAITFAARNMQAKGLARDLPVLPVKSGVLKADADVKSSGKKLDIFLANLRGAISASGEKTGISQGDNALELESLSLSTKIKKGVFRQNSLGLEAKWQANAKGAPLDAQLDLDGMLWFGGSSRNLFFQNIPGKLNFRLPKKQNGLKNGLEGNIIGNFSSRTNQLEIAKARIELPGMHISGNIQLDYGKSLSWKGNLRTATENLPEQIRKITGNHINIPVRLHKFSIESDFSGKPDFLELSKINGRIGNIAFGGKFSMDYSKKLPSYKFALQTDKLDLAQLAENKKSDPKKWNFDFLRSFNANGKLEIGDLSAYGLHFKRFSTPLTLEMGKLQAGPATAIFYGANMHARGHADFNKGINFGSSLEILAFDIGKLCQDRKMKSILRGMASIKASVTAKLTGSGQLPKALNGTWSFRLKDGSWQKAGSKGKPTLIKLSGASGTLGNGIAKCNNFFMQNNSLKVNGGGWIDLSNQKLDCNFNVDMKGIPNFPLHLYGTINKPQTSIGTGKMVLNALGGITNGLVDIFATLVEGTWNIFR